MPRSSIYHYDTDTIKDVDGNRVTLARIIQSASTSGDARWSGRSASRSSWARTTARSRPFLANASIEAPAFQLEDGRHGRRRSADPPPRPGLAHPRADVAAGLQLYIPTGRYTPGGDNNLGKGMWTYEPFVGATVFFDEKRRSASPPPPTGSSTARRRTATSRSARSSRSRRPGQVVPRRRLDHRRGVLRAVEDHRGPGPRIVLPGGDEIGLDSPKSTRCSPSGRT